MTQPAVVALDGRRRHGRAMLWLALFIVISALVLPAGSYVLTSIQEAAAQSASPGAVNPRSNFWRVVRRGNEGYSAVRGPETNVLIDGGGQNWRELRMGPLIYYGGWFLVGVLVLIVLFFLIRGRLKLVRPRSGRMVPRWNFAERFMHWYTATLFVVLAITGLSMLFGRALLIPLFGARGFAAWADLSISTHNYVGPFFSLGVLAMLIFWIKNNIPKAVDFKWLLHAGGLFGGKAHLSAGKANGGEKIWYWTVILLGLVAVCVSGFALIGWLGDLGAITGTRFDMQVAHLIHAVAALIWIGAFFGHAYIGSIGTEGVLEGMTRGSVSEEWALQHHDLWLEDVRNRETVADDVSSRTAPQSSGSV